jgi:ATP-dependent helicase/nuclease subunit A
MLGNAMGVEIDALMASQVLPVGDSRVEVQVAVENLVAPARPKSAAGARKPRNWRAYVDLWMRRRTLFEMAGLSPVFLTPTYLKRREAELAEAAPARPLIGGDSANAMVVGDLAHRFLQGWDFAVDPGGFREPLAQFVERALPGRQSRARQPIRKELEDILAAFFASNAYGELAASRILGREVPLLLPWDGNIMEGVIDLIYERGGLLCLADYKTDRIAPQELASRAAIYHQQGAIYTRAAEQGLGRSVATFKLIFLRLGAAVEVPLPAAQGELFR